MFFAETNKMNAIHSIIAFLLVVFLAVTFAPNTLVAADGADKAKDVSI